MEMLFDFVSRWQIFQHITKTSDMMWRIDVATWKHPGDFVGVYSRFFDRIFVRLVYKSHHSHSIPPWMLEIDGSLAVPSNDKRKRFVEPPKIEFQICLCNVNDIAARLQPKLFKSFFLHRLAPLPWRNSLDILTGSLSVPTSSNTKLNKALSIASIWLLLFSIKSRRALAHVSRFSAVK